SIPMERYWQQARLTRIGRTAFRKERSALADLPILQPHILIVPGLLLPWTPLPFVLGMATAWTTLVGHSKRFVESANTIVQIVGALFLREMVAAQTEYTFEPSSIEIHRCLAQAKTSWS